MQCLVKLSIALSLVCCVAIFANAFDPQKDQAKEAKDAKKNDGQKTVPIKDESGIVWQFDYLDKTHGIRIKSVKVKEEKNERTAYIVLDFTKDVENLVEMRKCFGEADKTGPSIVYYLFDEENIVIAKQERCLIEGELTGKKGDAFRLILPVLYINMKEKIRKVEVRPTAKS